MRLHVRHSTTYTYDSPVRGIVQTLRVTPRDHEGQNIISWRVDVDCDGRLREGEDELGNIIHTFSTDGSVQTLCVMVEGELDTSDTTAIVRGTVERFPPDLFRRDTSLTTASPDLRTFAHEVGAGLPALSALHALLEAVNDCMAFDTSPTTSTTSAADAFALKRGVCQDFAHVFIAAARHLGIPARYVGGHLWRDDGAAQTAGHAWVEAFVPDLGWVGFDPANKVCPNDAYLRVAVGLDYLGAAPVRGARSGSADETMDVNVSVTKGRPGASQIQSQS